MGFLKHRLMALRTQEALSYEQGSALHVKPDRLSLWFLGHSHEGRWRRVTQEFEGSRVDREKPKKRKWSLILLSKSSWAIPRARTAGGALGRMCLSPGSVGVGTGTPCLYSLPKLRSSPCSSVQISGHWQHFLKMTTNEVSRMSAGLA